LLIELLIKITSKGFQTYLSSSIRGRLMSILNTQIAIVVILALRTVQRDEAFNGANTATILNIPIATVHLKEKFVNFLFVGCIFFILA